MIKKVTSFFVQSLKRGRFLHGQIKHSVLVYEISSPDTMRQSSESFQQYLTFSILICKTINYLAVINSEVSLKRQQTQTTQPAICDMIFRAAVLMMIFIVLKVLALR